jgi:hypothetical protein
MMTHPLDKPTTEPNAAEVATFRALIKQLPMTLRPALNGQLAEWDTLFPFERLRTRGFMHGIATFDVKSLAVLLEPMRELEAKMGVERWDFSETADTMENASLLARSAYYSEWRDEVRRIYRAIETEAHASTPPSRPLNRLIVVILPRSLPYERATLWKSWGVGGVEVSIDGDPTRIAELLLAGPSSISELLARQGSTGIADFWLIDVGSTLEDTLARQDSAASLSHMALGALREHVLAQVNTVPKSIQVTDETLAAVRRNNWDPWWPTQISGDAPLRRFVIDLYLSGNGALIFSNSFVEWAASEAIRRARPRVIVARFGLRAKPKPFTGIAIFENQHRISTLPDVDDPQGSAVDASELARYIQLSAQRYPEGVQTAFLCVAESAQSGYLILPENSKSAWSDRDAATPEKISQFLIQHLSG